MESQKPTRRWGEILISLVILISICVPGMETMNCGKTTCGHGTSCVKGGCRCNQGYAGLRSVPESNVLFCSKSCWSQSQTCPDKTACELVLLYTRASLVFKRLCECSSKDRSPSTGECVDFTADGCRGRCGYRATCVQGVCGCTEDSDIPISFPDRSLQFCLQRCGTGWGVCPVNTTCEKVGVRNLCLCSAGAQRSAKGQCLDIDECEKKPERCGNNAVCVNTEGNHRCACAEGYRQREGKEVGCNLDIDECTENPTICGNNSVCTNTMGNYTCACAEGYRQRKDEEVGCSLSKQVSDIDECTENQTICGNNSVCANTVGNYTCACAVGYRQREGEEVGCNLVVTAAAASTAAPPSTAADSSTLTIGLAVGIGGVVLLAVVALAVVVSRRNMSSRNPTTSHNTDHSYQNVIGLPVPERTRRSYGTDYGAVPEPGVSAANQGPGSAADVSTRSTIPP
ncbi:adhesion G protein-coupled receptor E2-like [Liolophura sinensis]|uniref:adhesion G protein-coupled receptor E2-like n=1 Tax=Liolophura sinensis TaxID=3198878 RepID=UPI0031598C5B